VKTSTVEARCSASTTMKPKPDAEHRVPTASRYTKPTRVLRDAVAVFRFVADEHGTPTTPTVAVGPGIPSSTEEGNSFLRSFS